MDSNKMKKTTNPSPLMKRFKKAGLLGCFDGTGVNSENCKEILYGKKMTDDLVESLKHLIKCYDLVCDPENASCKEITMWRLRFLHHMQISKYSREIFMSSPSKEMIKKTPEEFLEENCCDKKI